MNDIEKIKRHLGKPIPIPIKNEDGVEDIFYFKPLNVGQQAILVEIGNKMREKGTINLDGKEIPKVSKEDTNNMFDLILDICKTSFPDLESYILSDFANSNYNQIAENLDKLLGRGSNKENVDLIKQAREARKVGKDQ